mgnify:CR=1 FL=1
MSEQNADELLDEARRWWTTSIIDIHPGEIAVRGYPIQELIGNVTFPEMIWLMLMGELPTREKAALLEAALVSSVDHGPQAPSIAIARMAGWSAHRIEELVNPSKIIRPAYMNVQERRPYVGIGDR